MKAIDRRLRRLEEQGRSQVNERGQTIAEVLRERRRLPLGSGRAAVYRALLGGLNLRSIIWRGPFAGSPAPQGVEEGRRLIGG